MTPRTGSATGSTCLLRASRAWYACFVSVELPPLITAVEAALADTEREYGQMPFFVRPMVKRGFVKRTGRDFGEWRALLSTARRGDPPRDLVDALSLLSEHYLGAPERAKRGMGATPAQYAAVEQRSRARSDAALALREALLARQLN